MKYSFIIPAYNAEHTIQRTVDSIGKMVLDCEIIVVENGSTDGTDAVLAQLSADQRVKYLHCEKGVSRARNVGLENALGKWVCFVDADDVWSASEETLRSITDAHSRADVIICGYYKDADVIRHDYVTMDAEIRGDALLPAFSWLIGKPTLRTEVWAKLFRRDFLASHCLTFDEELTHSEDAEFMIRVMEKCECLVISAALVYRYSSGTPSTMRSVDNAKTAAYLRALNKIDDHAILHTGAMKAGYRDFVVSHLNLIAVHEIFNREMKIPYRERRAQIKKLLAFPIIMNAVEQITPGETRDLFLLPAYLFKKRMYMAGGCICMIRSIQNSRRFRRFRS